MTINTKTFHCLHATTLSSALVLATAAANAQNGPNVLEEIIVTAQKRAENVQNIPVTINVVTGETLDSFTIRNTNDLADAVPGLTIQQTPQNLAQVTVRGLGTGSGGESLDQSVGLFVDGIWAGRIREFQSSLFDVERVEVIKGTQNTLLGKNTSLGAISVISRRPGEVLGGYLQGDYEMEYGSVYLSGALDIPTALGNFRLAFNDVAEEGYVDNSATGNEVPERDQTTLRASGAWEIGDNGNLLISYQYDELEIFGDTFQPDNDSTGFLQSMDPNIDVGADTRKHARTSYSSSGEAEDEQDSQRAFLQYDHLLGEHTFTALTGWSEYDNERLTDSDFMSVDYLNTQFTSDYEQFSQEIRIASPDNDQLTYVGGLLYLQGDMTFTNLTDASFPPPFLLSGLPLDSSNRVLYEQDMEVWSLFGQTEYALTERLRVTLGLRYTDEHKEAVWERKRLRLGPPPAEIIANILAPTVPPTDLDRSEDNLDGSINLQFDMNEDSIAYASWARGSKSGGFATGVNLPENAEYDTEEAETSELGFKMDVAGGAGHLNASLFFTEIDNFQIITFTGTAFLTETVQAESYGAEIESRWILAQGLYVGASATYAHAEDKDSGLQLPYAPEWSASIDAHYEYPLTEHGMVLNIDGMLNYRDEQYQQRDERSLDGALTLLDIRIGLASAEGTWDVGLLGRNLLDQASSFGFDFPGFGGMGDIPVGAATIGSLNRPLTVALQGRYNF